MIQEEIKRGDVLIAELPHYPGSVQSGNRPVVVIQNDVGNHYSNTIIVVPATTAPKKYMPTHVKVYTNDGFLYDSTVLCEHILTIDKSVVFDKIGSVPVDTMRKINIATLVSLGYV